MSKVIFLDIDGVLNSNFWNATHPETDGWVVLEDLDLHNEEVARHQVMTDQTVGMTEADVETAVRILDHLL